MSTTAPAADQHTDWLLAHDVPILLLEEAHGEQTRGVNVINSYPKMMLPAVTLLAALLLVSACSSSSAKSPADGITQTTRQMLIDVQPTTAPGQDQVLTRVIIPAGAVLAPHTHPGSILSIITQGTLTYTVYRDGTAILIKNAASAKPEKTEIKPGETTEIDTGDALYEPKGMVHSAKNAGKDAVIIYQSSLVVQGAPASSPATP